LSLLIPSRAPAEGGPTFRSLESQAMGRSGVAASNGAAALFLNPAGLGGDQGGNMGLSVDMGLNSVLLDYASWVKDNYSYIGNLDTMSNRIGPIDNKWAPFSNSLLINGRYQDIAFALLSDTRYDLTISKAVVTPVLGVGALSDLVLTAGRGVEGPDGYHFGVSFKYLYRVRYEDRLVGTSDDDFYKVYTAWRKPDNGVWSKLAKIQVAGDIAKTEQGVGVNLGVEKDVTENWTAGVSLIDFPTLIDARFARPDVNMGLGYHRHLDWLEGLPLLSLVNVDFQRFLTPGTPWWRQLKLGTAMEGYVGKRKVAYLAFGLNDGYPTFGVSLGYIAYVSYVYVAEEVGTFPGQEKLSFHKLCINIDI
jgi:hypothetical protein